MPSTSVGKRSILTYCQRKVARELASTNRHAINADVDLVLNYIDDESKQLSKKHKRSVTWFHHQFFQGGRVIRQKQAVSVFKAAKQIEAFLDGHKGDLTEDEKACFTEISLKIKQLDLMALTACTGMETMLCAVKGHAKHSMPGYISVSAKVDCYLIHGLKKYTSDIAKEFETYVLTDIGGLTLNHNGRLAELKRKIRTEICQGLGRLYITNDAKAMMQFDRYEKLIVVDRRVKLENWPKGIPFVNASEIGSFHDLERLLRALTLDDYEDRCRWVTLSEEEWQQCQKAYYDAHLAAKLKRRKCKGRAAAESDSNDGSSDSKNGEAQAGPRK
ncbi:hypothetical protein K439DRAFT_1614350 [Ramaria rubella]|nr:hypothetical protein K439DRAFT_1614350 [Ramaria rubella]